MDNKPGRIAGKGALAYARKRLPRTKCEERAVIKRIQSLHEKRKSGQSTQADEACYDLLIDNEIRCLIPLINCFMRDNRISDILDWDSLLSEGMILVEKCVLLFDTVDGGRFSTYFHKALFNKYRRMSVKEEKISIGKQRYVQLVVLIENQLTFMVEEGLSKEELSDARSCLSDIDRRMIDYKYNTLLSVTEVCKVEGITSRTIHKRHSSIIYKLKNFIGRYDMEPIEYPEGAIEKGQIEKASMLYSGAERSVLVSLGMHETLDHEMTYPPFEIQAITPLRISRRFEDKEEVTVIFQAASTSEGKTVFWEIEVPLPYSEKKAKAMAKDAKKSIMASWQGKKLMWIGH